VYHFVIAMWSAKETESSRVNYWQIIADNLSKAGWSWGCVLAIDREGRTIWIVDAHRGDGRRFVVRADEKLTAFTKLESAIRCQRSVNFVGTNAALVRVVFLPWSFSRRTSSRWLCREASGWPHGSID
jgi:hypothetical protein